MLAEVSRSSTRSTGSPKTPAANMRKIMITIIDFFMIIPRVFNYLY